MVSRETIPKHSFDALFRPMWIGPHHFSNRLVALPVFTGYAFPNGAVSPFLLEHYQKLAASGVSMVVVANAAVDSAGTTSRHSLRVDRDDYIAGLSQLATVIQKEGALACLQLNHAGRFAKTEKPFLPSSIKGKNLAFNIAALKDFMEFFPLEKRFRLTRYFLKMANNWHIAMTEEDKQKILKAFGKAAERAYRAGFDMIELHGANGYLLCQFLSAFTNTADSDQGADFQKRAQFPIMVLKEMRGCLPPNFPIGFRLILREWVPGGIDLEEAIAFAKLLQNSNIAYISGAVGTFNSMFLPEVLSKISRPAYLKDDMTALKQAVDVPTIISGRITTPNIANQILRGNVADIVGLGRPLRVDPDWVHTAAAHRAKVMVCINCHDCLKRVILEEGFSCRRWPKLCRQRINLSHKLLFHNDNILCVVTGIEDLSDILSELRRFLPVMKNNLSKILLTILRISADGTIVIDQEPGPDMIHYTHDILNRDELIDIKLSHVAVKSKFFYNLKTKNTVSTDNYGMLLMCRQAEHSWQTHLLYRERRKILGLLSPNQHSNNIFVPVDRSDATLLVLEFLKRTYLQITDVNLHFVHVSKASERIVQKRWGVLKQICDLDSSLPSLVSVSPSGDIASTIMEVVNRNKFGTIVMGKRGLSGIKRWLLGSVSVGVLRLLRDQSLFLID